MDMYMFQQLIKEKVTMSAGVPTIWLMLLAHLNESNITSLPHLERLIIGGSNAPPSLVHAFETM
jgi:acyl-CoA synthetase (AMP-forming)/AMP-acid ligase II